MSVIQPIRVVWGKLGQSLMQMGSRLWGSLFSRSAIWVSAENYRGSALGAQNNWESCLEHALCAWGYSSLEGLLLVVQLPS